MDARHPKNADPRPKRRKDQDNPYTIFTTGIVTDDPHYYISFRDGQGKHHCIEIAQHLYELFNSYELDDLSFLNEVDNHYEHSELTEISLHARAFHPQDDLEAATIRDMEYVRLHAAISSLPEIQRRRLWLYFFEEFTYEEIAVMEGCTKRAVKFSVDLALQKLKEKF